MARRRSEESSKIPGERCGYFPALVIVFRLDLRLRFTLELSDQQKLHGSGQSVRLSSQGQLVARLYLDTLSLR
jgi:hypothetical protein